MRLLRSCIAELIEVNEWFGDREEELEGGYGSLGWRVWEPSGGMVCP